MRGFSQKLLVKRQELLSVSKHGRETPHTLITDQSTRRSCTALSDADLRREKAGHLGTAAPAEGAGLIGSGRGERGARLQKTDTQRAQQTRADPLAFIQQTKQKMRRADALFSLALHLFCCQEDHLFGARGEQLERVC